MTPSDRWCEKCAGYTQGGSACGYCGSLRKSEEAGDLAKPRRTFRTLALEAVLGFVVGMLFAAVAYVVWGLGNAMVMGIAAGTGQHACVGGDYEVYASTGALVYRALLVIVTVVLVIVGMVFAVRMTRARKPGMAIALMVALLVGLVPATMCNASNLYGPC